MKRRKRKYSTNEVLEAIKKGKGVKFYVASALGCSRGTLDKYIAENKEVAQAFVDEREKFKDVIEAQARRLMLEENNVTMCIFLLKTLCKDRGYVESVDVNSRVSVAPRLTISPEDVGLFDKNFLKSHTDDL